MEEFKLLLSVLGIIGLLVLLIVGSKWLTKKVSYRSTDSIKIVERLPLGQDKALIIVKVGSKYMLLSMTQHHIEKIDDLEGEEIESLINKPVNFTGNQAPSFSKALQTVIKEKFGSKGGGDNEKD